jgi:hypothetical protein
VIIKAGCTQSCGYGIALPGCLPSFVYVIWQRFMAPSPEIYCRNSDFLNNILSENHKDNRTKNSQDFYQLKYKIDIRVELNNYSSIEGGEKQAHDIPRIRENATDLFLCQSF